MEEGDGEPRNQDPQFISETLTSGVTFLQSYGWFLMALALVALYLRSKLAPQLSKMAQARETAREKKIDSSEVQQRHEAMERARAKMQEQLDAQSQQFVEKQKEREELKRQEKIAQFDADSAGRSRPRPASTASPSPTQNPSGGPKKKKNTLRPDYNPLMGDVSGGACFRPTRRGGAGGG